MPNIINKMVVRELSDSLADADGMIIVNMSGLTVHETEALRNELAEQGVRLNMVRNRLVRLALCERGIEPPADMFIGNVAMAWGSAEDAIFAAKTLSKCKAAKDGRIKFKGGLLEGNLLEAADAAGMAKLPGRKELQAMLLGVISGPARGLVGILHAPGSSLARVIQAHADEGGAD